MYNNEFFVVDMSSCTSTGEIINSLSLALETLNHTGKKIILKLNDTHLNQSQLLSIQSLITSYGCTLDTVETTNEDTVKIAENMNILVQEPIEKRIDDRYKNEDSQNEFKSFGPSSDSLSDNSIAVKEVSGLHFEADLDALEKQQENINIASDLREVGVNRQTNFSELDEKLSSKISSPFESEINTGGFEKFESNTSIGLNALNSALEQPVEVAEGEKNSIGVYKKAYDEFSADKEDWEEVDFYETPTTDPVVSDTKTTMYINQTLRSGQIIESDGNVVIIGDCHPGSEIRAVGDITVWGILSGIAHAGYKGNINAKIRALKMNAVQLRISNCYSRRPDSTNIPYIIKSSVFTPEEARAVDNEIMLFKINQN